MKRLSLAALLCALAGPARAQFTSSYNGTTTAEFLNLGVGARAVAMGQAFSAAADDATALYWNPAALTNVKGGQVTLMHAAYVASSYFDYGAVAKNLGSYGAVGAGLQYFSLGGVNGTDASGNSIGVSGPYDLAASLGYAYRFTSPDNPLEGFSIGASGKLVQQKIVTSESAFAADVGVLSPAYLKDSLRFAFTVLNAGPAVSFDAVSDPMPLTLKVGSAYKILPGWLATLDIAAPRGGNPYAGVGTEYEILNDGSWTMAARGGYNSQTLGSISGFSGASMGFGLGYKAGSFDYAFVPMGGLGQAHRFSVNFRF